MGAMPDLRHERAAGWPEARVAGVDEVGRGAWAGPVVAAAVLWPAGLTLARPPWTQLRDSKQMTPPRRAALARAIRAACPHGVGQASAAEIDASNILRASLLAMRRALMRLLRSGAGVDALLIDGRDCPPLPAPLRQRTELVIGGDARAASIAAASIVAKTCRDRWMQKLACAHPAYGWARNKGYGTQEHRAALMQFGAAAPHRRSYAPVGQAVAVHG